MGTVATPMLTLRFDRATSTWRWFKRRTPLMIAWAVSTADDRSQLGSTNAIRLAPIGKRVVSGWSIWPQTQADQLHQPLHFL